MKLVDCLKQTITATNLSTMSMGAAVTGFRTVAQAIADGDLAVGDVDVPMMARVGAVWEFSLFTVTSATLLTRQSVLGSSAGGAAVTFPAGNKEAFCDVPAEYLAGKKPSDLPTLSLMTGDLVLAYRPSTGVLGLLLASSFGTGGTTAPVDNAPTLSAASATVTGAASATGSVTTNETGGTLYWLFSTSSTATAAAVKAGSSKTVTALGAQSVAASTLTASTQYYLHFLHRDTLPQGSAVLTVGPFTTQAAGSPTPTVTGVTVSPSTANVAGGATQQYNATVAGANSPSQGVNWTCSAGTINSAGLFTAPAATSSAQTITITATSQQDGTTAGTATATVAAAAPAEYSGPAYVIRVTNKNGTDNSYSTHPKAAETRGSSGYLSASIGMFFMTSANVAPATTVTVKAAWVKRPAQGVNAAAPTYNRPASAGGNTGAFTMSRLGAWVDNSTSFYGGYESAPTTVLIYEPGFYELWFMTSEGLITAFETSPGVRYEWQVL